MTSYLYDEHRIRYHLISTKPDEPYNWLFLPGGPGADSRYLKKLVDLLKLPGKVWLVDLPGNGDNLQGIPPDYNFDTWFDLLMPLIQNFENPILAGHSFGGMLPLLFPELEEHLKGLVILNSAPSLWLEEAVFYARKYHLPDLSKEIQDFNLNPNEATFKIALNACMPYYFPPSSLEIGKEMLQDLPFPFQPAVWWQLKASEINFCAEWIPKQVPTLIIGGTFDCICPFSLFQKDLRFNRPNIKMVKVEKGGHMPWIEDPQTVVDLFQEFKDKLVLDPTS